LSTNVEARQSTAVEGDWTVQTADTIDRVVANIRSKTSDPLVGIARWIVFGLLAFILGTLAVALLAIAAVRVVVVYLPVGDNRVWVAQLIVGGFFSLLGVFLFSLTRPRQER
jgi:hypothetical protein